MTFYRGIKTTWTCINALMPSVKIQLYGISIGPLWFGVIRRIK